MSCRGVTATMSQTKVIASLSQLIVLGIICQDGYAVPQYVYYTDSTAWYRKGVRDGYYVIDIRLTASPGWDGDEDTDWKNLYSIKDDA